MSDNSSTNAPLTVDEMVALQERLKKAKEDLSASSDCKLSEETSRDICETVRRCDGEDQNGKDLLDLAHIVAINATWPHFMREAERYLDGYRTEMEDLYQAYCICVYKSLPYYSPGQDIFSFMAPRARAAFASERAKTARL